MNSKRGEKMWCNQIFALISVDEAGKGKVENIIVCDNIEWANQMARSLYGDTALALDTTWYPLKIGDNYIDGRFYSDDGNEIKKNLTEEERIALLQEENIFLKEQQAEQDEMILENNYHLLLMQESIEDIV